MKTREQKRDELVKHYSVWGRRPEYIQHMLDLDDEFPEVDMFGPHSISAEVGPGWAELLRPVLQALRDNGCKVGQIKQKFGGLRVYWNYPDNIEDDLKQWMETPPDKRKSKSPLFQDDIERLHAVIGPVVKEAERLSFLTCEDCGASLKEGGPSWKTLCAFCRADVKSR